MRILFFGDIVGKPGRKALARALSEFCERYQIDLVGANVENSAGGFGLTLEVYEQLIEMGIDFMTSGNHIWDKKELLEKIDEMERLVRPLNYSPLAPGKGLLILNSPSGPIAIFNLSGRIFMEPAECPFLTLEQALKNLPQEIKMILVDFHGEATSEKLAFAWDMDGRVSAVIGTHTHIQTADERVLPKGTAYITDVGMCGPINSVIGIKPEQSIERFRTGIPYRFEVASGPLWINAVVIDLNPNTGKANSIQRIQKVLEA